MAAGRARVEELRAAQEEAAAARARASAGDGKQEAELSEQSKALQTGLIEAARRLEVVIEQLRSQTDALHSTLTGKASQESEREQLQKTVAALEAAAEAAAAAAHAEDSEKKKRKRLRRTRSEENFLLSNVEARARVYAIEAASAADEALQQQLKEQEVRAVTALAGILLSY